MGERVGALTGKQAMSVLTYLQGKGNSRDVALWAVGIGTGLRISDILDLRWKDVVTAEGDVAKSITVKESKTGNSRTIRLIPLTRDALESLRGDDTDRDSHVFTLTRQHVRRLVKDWCAAVNLKGDYGTHTMRKAFCTIVYENSGGDPVNAARVTGHSNPSQLMHYIGQTPPTIDRIWKGVESTLKG
jgi:integrase